ncbi:hypothetical protein GO986_19255 [Deinococcus sp. HMF7620]|uniref:Uncharacterized protein n=1 Tax=Deinococcus arboris TaxID=2682977 RepID=A0A7C9MB52_9DEIO|nr:hypothetical protein [Deinococcus arboris]MVN88883.1 hypothetical protein [Deinococcus arboris]
MEGLPPEVTGLPDGRYVLEVTFRVAPWHLIRRATVLLRGAVPTSP